MSKRSEAVKKWRQIAKKVILECLGGQCQICKYNKSTSALETHHVVPTEKDYTISFILSSCRSWEVIYKELTKCILLCSNCHREIHDGLTVIPEQFCRFDPDLADQIRIREGAVTPRRKRSSKQENDQSFENFKKRLINSKKSNNLKYKKQDRINNIKNSNITFSEYGWVTKAANLIGISPQKVVPWMRRNMQDFYEKECYKRI